MTPGYKAVVLRWLAQNNATWEAVSGVFNKDGNDPSYGERIRLNLAYFEAMQSQRFDSNRNGGSLLGFL